MNTRTLYLNCKSRSLIVRVPLALLLTFTIVLSGSVALASNVPFSKTLKAPTLKSGGFESESVALEPRLNKESASGPDSDVLNLAGDWNLTFGGVGIRLDSFNHYVPVEPLWANLRVHFDYTEPGAFGGRRFEGYYIDCRWLGTFYAETLYDGWGVQLVQIRWEEPDRGSGRYYKILCGKHQLYEHDPKRVEVFGAYTEVGSPSAYSGMVGNFVMVKP